MGVHLRRLVSGTALAKSLVVTNKNDQRIEELSAQDLDNVTGGTREHVLLARQTGATAAKGDWDGDGDVDSGDFVAWTR